MTIDDTSSEAKVSTGIAGVPQLGAPPAPATMASVKRRLLKGGAWALTGQVGGLLAGMISSILLARILSPDDLGAYFLALSIVMTASQFALFGLPQTVVRFVAKSMAIGKPGRARKSIEYAFASATAGAIMAGLIVYLAGDWLGGTVFQSSILKSTMGLVALWTTPSAFRTLIAESFRGFQDIRLASIFGGFSFKTISTILFLWIWITRGQTSLTTLLVLVILATTFPAISGGTFLIRKVRTLGTSAPVSRRAMLDMAFPLFIMSVAVFGLKQSSLWITGAYLPENQVALFGAAMRLVIMMAMPLSLVNAVVPPIIAEMHAQDRRRDLERTLRMVSTIGGIPAVAVLLVFIFSGKPLLGLVYGEYYRQAAVVLAILSMGQLVNVWSGSCGFALMMTGNHMIMTIITVTFGVANVVISIFVIPRYGITGAAIAWSASLITQNIVTVLITKRYLGVWTHVSFLMLNDFMKIYQKFAIERKRI